MGQGALVGPPTASLLADLRKRVLLLVPQFLYQLPLAKYLE